MGIPPANTAPDFECNRVSRPLVDRTQEDEDGGRGLLPRRASALLVLDGRQPGVTPYYEASFAEVTRVLGLIPSKNGDKEDSESSFIVVDDRYFDNRHYRCLYAMGNVGFFLSFRN